jgi:hypothetical protein
LSKRFLAGVAVLTIGLMSLVAPGAAQSGSAGSGGSSGSSGGGDAAAAKKYYGTWSGTWEGEGQTGGFHVTLEAGKDGKPGGYVDVTGEPTYKAALKTLAFDGAKMTATYDFPPDPSVTVTLGATFEGDTAKGTWALKSSNLGALAGTWTVKKK